MNLLFGWRGKEEFVENTQKKKVLIHKNGDFENGKGIYSMIVSKIVMKFFKRNIVILKLYILKPNGICVNF